MDVARLPRGVVDAKSSTPEWVRETVVPLVATSRWLIDRGTGRHWTALVLRSTRLSTSRLSQGELP